MPGQNMYMGACLYHQTNEIWHSWVWNVLSIFSDWIKSRLNGRDLQYQDPTIKMVMLTPLYFCGNTDILFNHIMMNINYYKSHLNYFGSILMNIVCSIVLHINLEYTYNRWHQSKSFQTVYLFFWIPLNRYKLSSEISTTKLVTYPEMCWYELVKLFNSLPPTAN